MYFIILFVSLWLRHPFSEDTWVKFSNLSEDRIIGTHDATAHVSSRQVMHFQFQIHREQPQFDKLSLFIQDIYKRKNRSAKLLVREHRTARMIESLISPKFAGDRFLSRIHRFSRGIFCPDFLAKISFLRLRLLVLRPLGCV